MAAIRWLEEHLRLSVDEQAKLLLCLVVAIVAWLVRIMVLTVVYRHTEDVRLRYRWRKAINAITWVTTLLFAGAVWLPALRSIGTFVGLLSAGLTIALRDLVTGIAGWAFIIWRRPFQLGDRIQIGEFRGDVVDLRLFQFTLMEIGNWVDADQSTGRIVHVPNGRVLSEVLANYNRGFEFIWNEIPVLVTLESNWRHAKAILQELANRHAEQLGSEAEQKIKEAAKRYMIFYSKLTPIVYTSVKDSGILLTVRYLCKPQRRRVSQSAIWEDILDEFSRAPDIALAYPTIRYYDNAIEGSGGPQP